MGLSLSKLSMLHVHGLGGSERARARHILCFLFEFPDIIGFPGFHGFLGFLGLPDFFGFLGFPGFPGFLAKGAKEAK